MVQLISKKSNKQIYDINIESLLFLPANVYWLDTECRVLGFNDTTAKLFDLKASECIGLDYNLMAKLGNWTDGQEKSFQAHDLEVMSKGKPKLGVFEPPLPYPDGVIRYFVTTRMPLRNQDKKIVGALGISFEITNSIFSKNIDSISQAKISNINNKFALSPRQTQCLYYLVRGMTAKQIARALNLSNRTVEAYLVDLKDKLQCNNKPDLVAKAIEMGFANI